MQNFCRFAVKYSETDQAMAQFSYRARRRSGEMVQGVVDVADRSAALMQVERLGLFPIAVDLAKGAFKAEAAVEASGNRAAALLPPALPWPDVPAPPGPAGLAPPPPDPPLVAAFALPAPPPPPMAVRVLKMEFCPLKPLPPVAPAPPPAPTVTVWGPSPIDCAELYKNPPAPPPPPSDPPPPPPPTTRTAAVDTPAGG